MDRPLTLILGIVMALMGISGILRQESGALSDAERSTVMGRVITRTLGLIWVFAGLMFVIGSLGLTEYSAEVIGYTSLAASAAFMIVLLGAVLVAGVIHYRERQSDEPQAILRPVLLSKPTHPRFRR